MDAIQSKRRLGIESKLVHSSCFSLGYEARSWRVLEPRNHVTHLSPLGAKIIRSTNPSRDFIYEVRSCDPLYTLLLGDMRKRI